MIIVTKKGNLIEIQGHSHPNICAAFSTTMYVAVNILSEYDSSCIEFKDLKESILPIDKVQIRILKHDKLIDTIINVMMASFEDIHRENDSESKILIDRG